MPSSLTRVLSRTLGFSPYLPVSVYGTGTFIYFSGFSWQFGISYFVTCFHSPSLLRICVRRICLPHSLRAWTHFSNRALNLPFCVPTSVSDKGGIGFSTDCPSPTPFGLGLGPDLPWADEPSPGNLRFSVGRILTCLFATYTGILSSIRSTMPSGFCFDAE